MRLVERVDGAYVTPVALVTICRARHIVRGEVIHVGLTLGHEVRDDVATHVVVRVFILLVFKQGFDQRLRREAVVAHGRIGHIRIIRGTRRVGGLFQKLRNRAVLFRLDAAKGRGLLTRHADTRNRSVLARSNVIFHHLRGIHAVDVIRTED